MIYAKLKHLLSMLIFTLLLTTACEAENSVAPIPQIQSNLTLATEKDLDNVAQEAIELFVQKVSELSEGSLVIEIVYNDDPLSLLDAGADLLFAENQVIARANRDYSSYSSPFYFNSYEQATLALNSDSFYELTNDITKSLLSAYPIGAFYNENHIILSTVESFEFVEKFHNEKIYIMENEIFEYVLEEFGMEDISIKDTEEIISGFNRGRYHTIEISTLDLDKLTMPEKRTNINIINSNHYLSVNWLMVSEDLTEKLSDKQFAVIKEATAYAIAENDMKVAEIEESGYDYLDSLGSLVFEPNHDEFIEVIDLILMESFNYSNLWNLELHHEVRMLANK